MLMDFATLTKFLTERYTYLWAATLLAFSLILSRQAGYLGTLENSVVTTAILAGWFAGMLLLTLGATWVFERAHGKWSRRQ
jgi:hypothetical protein